MKFTALNVRSQDWISVFKRLNISFSIWSESFFWLLILYCLWLLTIINPASQLIAGFFL